MDYMKFEGIMPALLTPFEKDNRTVNEDVVKQLIDFQIEQGADGFYILGGTGEGLVMNQVAREIMCDVAITHINQRKPAICHVAAMNLQETIAMAKYAEKSGADAIASVPPIFFHYDGNDIYNYYKKIAENVHIPLIIYYHPAAQGDMSADLISRIFEIDNVTGVKWSSPNFYQMMKLKDKTHGEINIINGPDELLVSGLAAGADAGVGSTYNIMLPEFVKLYQEFKSGNHEAALERQLKINRVIDICIKHEVIPTVKYAATLMGYEVGEATYPLKAFSEDQKRNIERELNQCRWPFV